ncbi:SDR family oxidoreductase [Candidatus Pelagibacter sp.]|nr:SDR family oxidoreductase [Candidatus Pelagibacter sp.]
MKILLFGSEGNLGKEFSKKLKKKFDLTCIDYHKERSKKKFINIDLSKKIVLKKIKKNDVGIILSFYKSQPSEFLKANKIAFNKINHKILDNCLKICKINKVKKIIYLSSAAIYADNLKIKKISENYPLKPKTIYGNFKLQAEKKILQYGDRFNLDCINLRLFNYYTSNGNILINNFKKQLKKNKIFINGDGNQSRDFLHIDDMLSAIEYFINNRVKSSTFNLCSGNGTKIKDIINALIKKGNIINYTNKNQSNFFLVGNNKKLKKLINWKIQKNFNKFIQKL